MAADLSIPVIYFDGVCNLCNGWVQWVIKRDKQKRFRFASLQSNVGIQLLSEHHSPLPDSIILRYNGKVYVKAAAVLKILTLLGSIYQLVVIGFIVPGFIRNSVYDWVARNRYKWYGKRDKCMIPTPELQSRFLQ
jgi:predicted DCC family thiol-disulfide oxidoreductase YuxK